VQILADAVRVFRLPAVAMKNDTPEKKKAGGKPGLPLTL
jgi:hypothetical protein